ncbi:MAG: hypothetical protein UT66_C0006G0005 [candidate division CPR2 bacterium GW2011_GWC1_39_9]|nr:MAG: hypothetical protein UT66_C0006G0005 [candidate division CPR2 bacterium GW2011_GWC1_39_9]
MESEQLSFRDELHHRSNERKAFEVQLPEVIDDALGRKMVNDGFVEIGQNQEIVVSLNKFQEGPLQSLFPSLKEINEDYVKGEAGSTYFNPIPGLLDYFADKSVITAEDLKLGKDPKPMFYSPKTAQEALDIQQIKEADFYLGFWELSRPGRAYKKEYLETGLSAAAVEIACKAYNPNHGNGFVHNKQLFVYNSQGRTEKITADYFKREDSSYGRIKEFIASPRTFLENNPKLAESSLFKAEWFRKKTDLKGDILKKEIDKNGFVMLLGTRHFIGRNLANNPVYMVSKNYAVVTDFDKEGLERPISYFKIQPKTEREEGFKTLNAGQVDLRPFDTKKMHTQRKDEPEAEYQLRSKELEPVGYLWDLADKIQKETGINIFKVNFSDAQVIGVIAKEFGEEKVIGLIDNYGEDAIKALNSAHYDIDCAKAVMELGKTEHAKEIFEEYSKITDLAEVFSDLTKTSMESNKKPAEGLEDLHLQVREAVIRRAKDLLLAGDLIRSGESDLNFEDLKTGFISLRTILEVAQSFTGKGRFNLDLKESIKEKEQRQYIFGLADDKGDSYSLKVLFRPRIREVKNRSEEARINFALIPETDLALKEAFTQEITHASGKKQTVNDIRLGIDLAQDIKGDVKGVSMDIGRSPSENREGDLLGKLFDLASKHGSHNPGSFDVALKDPEVFALAVSSFQANLEKYQLTMIKKSLGLS